MSDPAEDPPAEDPPAEGEGEEAPAEDAPAEGEEAPAEGEEAGAGEGEGEGEEASPDGEEADGDAGGEDGGPSAIAERIEKDPLELEFLQPLPEKIEFFQIPRIMDCRNLWRQGMRKVEEVFMDHINAMHMDFETKARQFEEVQYKIERNHKWLEQFYVDM